MLEQKNGLSINKINICMIVRRLSVRGGYSTLKPNIKVE